MNTNKVSNLENAGLHLKSGNRLGKYRQSLSIVPEQRFPNADKMLAAMIKTLPKSQQKALKVTEQKKSDWHKVRREDSDFWSYCPWCKQDLKQ